MHVIKNKPTANNRAEIRCGDVLLFFMHAFGFS